MLIMILAGLSAKAAEKSCKRHPKVMGECFIVHGRLSRFNGTPSVRLWKVGTNRILGVSEGRFYLDGYRNLPESLEKMLSWETELFGNFLVCPFTHEKPGEMRLICIESASDLVKKKRDVAHY